jgi:hypothetical protein
MTLDEVLRACQARGVRIVIAGPEMRARGPRGAVNDALRQGLTMHKQAIVELLGDGEHPDETLPEVIHVPAPLPNTVEAICACIDSQRREVCAA